MASISRIAAVEILGKGSGNGRKPDSSTLSEDEA